MNVMKRPIVAILTAVMVMLASSSVAHAESTNQRITLFLKGDESGARVVASGPVRGVGTLHTESFQLNPDGSLVFVNRLVFDAGTLNVTYRGQFQLEPLGNCVTRTAVVEGSWEVTGGTGRYAGASGGGTFTDRGIFIGEQGPEGCSGFGTGIFRAVNRATGTVTLPDAAEEAA